MVICFTYGSVDKLIPKFLIYGETVFDDTASVKLSAECSHKCDFNYSTWSRTSQLSPVNPQNSEKSITVAFPSHEVLRWFVMQQQK